MAGLLYDGIPSTQIDSSNFSGTNIYLDTGSFTNVRTGGSVVGQRINDPNGALFSSIVGSPATYGAFVQGGSIVTGAGSTATITFGTNFAGSTAYLLTISPGSNAVANAGVGSVVPYTSLYTRSGANIVGAASTLYNWVAIGL